MIAKAKFTTTCDEMLDFLINPAFLKVKPELFWIIPRRLRSTLSEKTKNGWILIC